MNQHRILSVLDGYIAHLEAQVRSCPDYAPPVVLHSRQTQLREARQARYEAALLLDASPQVRAAAAQALLA